MLPLVELIAAGKAKDYAAKYKADTGKDLAFTYLAAHPDAAEAFHDAMAAGARLLPAGRTETFTSKPCQYCVRALP